MTEHARENTLAPIFAQDYCDSYRSQEPVWGKQVDRITESMLKEFSAENDLDHLKQETQFEHFVSYAVVQRLYGETFDTDDIVLGDDEFGIDGVAIIVNGVLVTDMDEFNAINEEAVTLDVAFIFKVGTEIFKEGQKLDPYYVAAYTLYRLEKQFRSGALATVHKAARFQILLAFRRLANPDKLPPFNSRDMETYCKSVIDVLWDTPKSDMLLLKAAGIVRVATGGNMHRDNIRTVIVTNFIKNYPVTRNR